MLQTEAQSGWEVLLGLQAGEVPLAHKLLVGVEAVRIIDCMVRGVLMRRMLLLFCFSSIAAGIYS